MRLALKMLAVLALGTGLGLLATWVTVFHGRPGAVRNGPWRSILSAGSKASGPYDRAIVAVRGLFALQRSEAAYYTAVTDSDRQGLDGRCRYRVTGRDPEARWWSITAYGSDDYLIPNPARRYSVSKASVARDPDGIFDVQLGGDAGGNDWIPVGPGRFSLTLRLYNPGARILREPAGAALPAVNKVSCR